MENLVINEDYEKNINDHFEKEKFTYSESNIFEFKQTFDQNNFSKYLETICAFLNGQGGYLIFGIKDDLDNIGIKLNSNQIDKIILKFDGIISGNKIIGNDQSNNILSLNHPSINTQVIINSKSNKFIIVKVKPNPSNAENKITYRLHNGKTYYRLGASNFYEKNEKFYTQTELDVQIKNLEDNCKKDNQQNLKLFQQTIDKYDKEKIENNTKIENLSQKVNELNDKLVLYEKNLIQPLKKNLDKQLTTNTHTNIYTIIKSIFPCL